MITLKTLKDATAQEVFDQVAEHLLTQNQKSFNPDKPNMCMYRNAMGLKCAIGCLVADDEYLEGWEGLGWLELIQQIKKDRKIDFERVHENLLGSLQRIHDYSGAAMWLDRLKSVAKAEGLNTKILEKYD